MTKVDMHIAEFYTETDAVKYKIYDAWSESTQPPSADTAIGGTEDLKNIDFSVVNGKPTITYTRLLKTGDSKDIDLSLSSNTVSIAYGDNALSYHTNRPIATSFSVTEAPIPIVDNLTKPFNFWELHGIALIICWSGLNFMGYCAGRFLKHHPWWLTVHFFGSSFTGYFSLGLLIASLVISLTPFTAVPKLPNYKALHLAYGLTFFILLCAQILLAYIPLLGIYKKHRVNTNLAHKLKIGHKVVGILLTFTVYISLITGFYMLYTDLVGIPAALCGLFLVSIIILEFRHYLLNKNKHERLYTNAHHINNITTILKQEDLDKEKAVKKFVIYENYICDVGNYIEYHPGGRNLLSDNLYSDVGRYMTGTQAYSKDFHQYDHNYQTYVYLLENLAYAKLLNDSNIVQTHNSNNVTLSQTFLIADKKEIAQNIYEYRITTNEFSFARFLTGHNWIGKHFSVTSKALNKTRYYTICLVLDDKLRDKHMSLLKSMKDDTQSLTEITVKSSNYMNIYSKRYNFPEALSNQLFNSQEELFIKGPMGIGLGLDPVLRGTHIVFAAGTGIFPFLDLIALTIRYICFKAKNFKINHEEKFENIGEDFKLIVFASFVDVKGSVFKEECDMLNDICRDNNINNFAYFCRLSSKDKSRWDKDFMKKNLKSFGELEKIHIVGPVPFMDSVRDALKASDVDVNKISFP